MGEEWFNELRRAIDADGRPWNDISVKAGLGRNYIQQMMRREQPPKLPTLDKILAVIDQKAARRVRVALPSSADQVPLKGYIGAGGEVFAEEFGADDTVEAPAERSPETVAARVRGTSMYPTFQDGWLIYWSKQLAPGDLVNSICVVQLEDDRIMVKTIMPGSKPGLWNLVSINTSTPPLIDQAVRWVAPIDWIRPR